MKNLFGIPPLWVSLCLLLGVFSANAADQNPPPAKALPVKAAPGAAATSPFFGYIDGGAGWSRVQNSLTVPGLDVQGTNKAWPTGMLLGGGFGIQSPNSAIGFVAAQLDVKYDFTRASIGCDTALGSVTGCAGFAKNSWRFAQEIQWSPAPTPAQMIGKLPTQAQPSHWPLAITTMDTWTSQVMILPTIGVVEKSIDLCATNQAATLAGQSSTACDTRWLVGFDFGADLRVPLSSSLDAKISYRYDLFNGSVNAANSPVFGNASFKSSGESIFTAGAIYHF